MTSPAFQAELALGLGSLLRWERWGREEDFETDRRERIDVNFIFQFPQFSDS